MAYYEFTIKISDQVSESLTEKLMELGSLGVVETSDSITAYFPETIEIKEITSEISIYKALLETTGQAKDISFSHTLIPEQDWNETWKKDFHAIDIGKQFTILPPWEEEKPGRINLVIDPAMAFGTGHHETTRSCLLLMERYADKTGKDNFLDLGTGTGLLAIAAAKLGYKHVLGIDIDPLSVDAAKLNIGINHVPEIEIRNGSIADCKDMYDAIAANLISGVLVQLAPFFPSRMKPGGIAYLSGILAEQADEVIEAMQAAGLELIEKYPDGKWVSLVVKK